MLTRSATLADMAEASKPDDQWESQRSALMLQTWEAISAERELPGVVRFRTTKGSSNSYLQHRIDSNQEFIRNLLIDGVLVRQGILDAEKLRGCLPGRTTHSNVPLGLLWAAVAAEAWSRVWA